MEVELEQNQSIEDVSEYMEESPMQEFDSPPNIKPQEDDSGKFHTEDLKEKHKQLKLDLRFTNNDFEKLREKDVFFELVDALSNTSKTSFTQRQPDIEGIEKRNLEDSKE